MWSVGSEPLAVYLGQAAAGAGGGGADGEPIVWHRGESALAVFDELAMLIRTRRPTRFQKPTLDVQLSGALARPFLFDAIPGLKSWREARTIAANLAPEATGLDGPCEVWLDDWRPGHACVAVAMNIELRDQLEEIVRRCKLKLFALRPWWSMAIEAQANQEVRSRMLAVSDTDALTIITATATDEYAALVTYAPEPEPMQARALLTRAAIAANVPRDDILWARLSHIEETVAEPELRKGLRPQLERWS